MSEIRLFIVTNNPLRALGDMLACATTNAPKWVRVVSDPIDIMNLPDGAKCQGAWYGPGTSAAESMWIERRSRGGIFFLSDEDRDRIAAWVEKHKARIDAALSGQRSAEPYSPSSPHPSTPAQPVLTQQWT